MNRIKLHSYLSVGHLPCILNAATFRIADGVVEGSVGCSLARSGVWRIDVLYMAAMHLVRLGGPSLASDPTA